MGTTSRYTYRIECDTNDMGHGFFNGKRGMMIVGVSKKPKDLKEWCEVQEKSERAGMPNEHAAKARGFLLAISSARLIRQRDNIIVSDYKADMFRCM